MQKNMSPEAMTPTKSRLRRVAEWAETITEEPKEIFSWGAHGWDTGEWPLVRYSVMKDAGDIIVMTYTEGDEQHYTLRGDYHVFPADAAAALLDELIGYQWARGWSTPRDYNPGSPAEIHKGPYTG